jgi:hypothetical protein
MNIRREYNSPNCILILDGFGDESFTSDDSKLFSVVINAECHFLLKSIKLHGGKVFLEKLTEIVNNYAQQLLSGIVHHQANSHQEERITIEKVPNSQLHRLTHYPNPTSSQESIILDLNILELFDLVDTLDQFLIDTRTLPELSSRIKPLSRHHRHIEGGSAAKRVLPLLIGLVGLVITGVGIYLMPIPKVHRPSNKSLNHSSDLIVPQASTSPIR